MDDGCVETEMGCGNSGDGTRASKGKFDMVHELVGLPEPKGDVTACEDYVDVEFTEDEGVAPDTTSTPLAGEPGTERILVLGGTGILRPAVLSLCASGRSVTVVSRHAHRLESLAAESAAARLSGSVAGVCCDYLNPQTLSAALASGVDQVKRYVSALLYCPDAGEDTLAVVGRAVSGPVVLLLTSRWDEPGRRTEKACYPLIAGIEPQRVRYVLLGWRMDPAGNRWHSAEEVSEAALLALNSNEDVKLGVTRPWGSRPR